MADDEDAARDSDDENVVEDNVEEAVEETAGNGRAGNAEADDANDETRDGDEAGAAGHGDAGYRNVAEPQNNDDPDVETILATDVGENILFAHDDTGDADSTETGAPGNADAAMTETATAAAIHGNAAKMWSKTIQPFLARDWPDLLIALAALLVIIALISAGTTAHERREEINRYESLQEQTAREFGFNPGYIVSDDVMFDSDSMSESEITTFLDERGVDCEGDMCLHTIRVSSTDQEADDLCHGYAAAENLSAAHIIRGVAESCGINPQVLIVMLQKEQGLVTATSPTETAYTIAMGLSCPDNGMCDSAYFGFFSQVYGAAHRLKYYQAHFDQYNYHPHEVNDILYNPDTSCGSGKVYIENDATAMLYIYTPYQPNEAALEGLKDGKGGTGDACSTYGNRNFALFFNAWFGDPTANVSA